MGLMIACGVLLAAGLAAAVAWGGRPFVPPPPASDPTPPEVAKRFVWWCALVFLSALLVGVPIIGAGGRLAMRLLAATAVTRPRVE